MKTFDEYVKEATTAAKMTNKDIVAILRSADFGHTEDGGNGDAKLVKGKIVVKDGCYYGCNDRLKSVKKSWEKGGHNYDYFKDTYGVDLKMLSSDMQVTGGTMFGKKQKDGVVTVTLTV